MYAAVLAANTVTWNVTIVGLADQAALDVQAFAPCTGLPVRNGIHPACVTIGLVRLVIKRKGAFGFLFI